MSEVEIKKVESVDSTLVRAGEDIKARLAELASKIGKWPTFLAINGSENPQPEFSNVEGVVVAFYSPGEGLDASQNFFVAYTPEGGLQAFPGSQKHYVVREKGLVTRCDSIPCMRDPSSSVYVDAGGNQTARNVYVFHGAEAEQRLEGLVIEKS